LFSISFTTSWAPSSLIFPMHKNVAFKLMKRFKNVSANS
jgi:hypothetical protein